MAFTPDISRKEDGYVKVAEDDGEEPIELPCEEDGTLSLTTVMAQFPGASGLKYKHPQTGTNRGIRLTDGRLHPPENDWGSHTYYCVFPKENKRKLDDSTENTAAKTKRTEIKKKCTDLIVLGLPWGTTEAHLKDYFQSYGDVLMTQIKRDEKGESKGFGFVRFATYDSQVRVLARRHMINDRWCDVKIPNSKEGEDSHLACKVFVGRLTPEITPEDLREYFSQFGEVIDIYIPKPFRAFGFVKFLESDVAQSLCGEDHVVKGVSVSICEAAPRVDMPRTRGRGSSRQEDGYGGGREGYGMSRDYRDVMYPVRGTPYGRPPPFPPAEYGFGRGYGNPPPSLFYRR